MNFIVRFWINAFFLYALSMLIIIFKFVRDATRDTVKMCLDVIQVR